METPVGQLRSVIDEILGALDPEGRLGSEMTAAETLAPWLGTAGEELARLASEHRRMVSVAARAHVLLVPRGWGVTNLPLSALELACAQLESGDEEAAEAILMALWDEGRVMRLAARAGNVGVADPGLRTIGRERRRLLTAAARHHLAGAYEASVPIVHSQIEGIVADISENRAFFSKSNSKADVTDPTRLASIASGLHAVRQAFCEDIRTSAGEGRLSRHGVAHGRELAYDTEIVSAKTWSLLDVVVEWALPVGRELADERRRERLDRDAGSDLLDERGARIDRREFSESREVLGLLTTAQMGWHRQLGRFRSDIVPKVYSTADFVNRGLPEQHGIIAKASMDGQEFWAFRKTVSGWILAISISHDGGGRFTEWHYGDARAPGGPPSVDSRGWTCARHPDWNS